MLVASYHGETKIAAEPGKKTIVMERMLDAPRWLVFEALTKPEYLKHWWGGTCGPLVRCHIYLCVGGRVGLTGDASDAFRIMAIAPAATLPSRRMSWRLVTCGNGVAPLCALERR